MRQRRYTMAGEALGEVERSLGTAVRTTVKEFYRGHDLTTTRTIRDPASSEAEAVKLVTGMRQGRAADVALVAGSAVAGVAAGAFLQHATGNPTIAGVSPVAVLGAVPAVAGLAAPVSLPLRAVLSTGGVAYAAGATLYQMLVGRQP